MLNLLCKTLLVLLLLGWFPVRAQEIEIGTGLICDTQKQIERYVAEFTTQEATLAAINADNENACGVLPVVYIRGEKISQVRNHQGTFDVVAIIVIGLVTPMGVIQGSPLPQFTLFLVKEEAA